jgi:hypothetical protein
MMLYACPGEEWDLWITLAVCLASVSARVSSCLPSVTFTGNLKSESVAAAAGGRCGRGHDQCQSLCRDICTYAYIAYFCICGRDMHLGRYWSYSAFI